jgi:hypothetical protein
MLHLSLSRPKVQFDKPHKSPCITLFDLSVEFEVGISSCEVGKFLEEANA